MISIYNLEDYKIIRDGIKFLLLQDKEFITAGDSDSPADLYDTLEKKEVDILILDIYLDGMENTIKINGFDKINHCNQLECINNFYMLPTNDIIYK